VNDQRKSVFDRVFGAPPQAVGEAPGRVNLLGEHTDHNEGFVLPIAIAQRTRVAMGSSPQPRFSLHAQGQGDTVHFTLDAPPAEHFASYVYGCLMVARSRGARIPPLQIHVESDVPIGVGLSSSAALEVATLRCLRELLGLAFDDVLIAQLAQQAEIEYAGVHCGIMDQLASSLADTRRALLLDTRTLERRFVDLPADSAVLVIGASRSDRAGPPSAGGAAGKGAGAAAARSLRSSRVMNAFRRQPVVAHPAGTGQANRPRNVRS
jgi:galactokinase